MNAKQTPKAGACSWLSARPEAGAAAGGATRPCRDLGANAGSAAPPVPPPMGVPGVPPPHSPRQHPWVLGAAVHGHGGAEHGGAAQALCAPPSRAEPPRDAPRLVLRVGARTKEPGPGASRPVPVPSPQPRIFPTRSGVRELTPKLPPLFPGQGAPGPTRFGSAPIKGGPAGPPPAALCLRCPRGRPGCGQRRGRGGGVPDPEPHRTHREGCTGPVPVIKTPLINGAGFVSALTSPLRRYRGSTGAAHGTSPCHPPHAGSPAVGFGIFSSFFISSQLINCR